jgi:hypothetical protein
MNYCERCTGVIAFINQELSHETRVAEVDLETDRYWTSPIPYRLDTKVAIGCSICALIFDHLLIDELSNIINLPDPHINVLVVVDLTQWDHQISHLVIQYPDNYKSKVLMLVRFQDNSLDYPAPG